MEVGVARERQTDKERERQRETDRQTDRDRQRQRQRETQTNRQTETDRQTQRQRERERSKSRFSGPSCKLLPLKYCVVNTVSFYSVNIFNVRKLHNQLVSSQTV